MVGLSEEGAVVLRPLLLRSGPEGGREGEGEEEVEGEE